MCMSPCTVRRLPAIGLVVFGLVCKADPNGCRHVATGHGRHVKIHIPTIAKTLPRAQQLTFVMSACIVMPSCSTCCCMSPIEILHVCLQCGGKLQQSLSGSAVDVFSKTLRGLAATKLTKPSAFRTADGAGYAVRCSYKVTHTCCCPLTISQGVYDLLHASKSANMSYYLQFAHGPSVFNTKMASWKLPISGPVALGLQI